MNIFLFIFRFIVTAREKKKPFSTPSLDTEVTITVNCIFHPERAFHTEKATREETSCGKKTELRRKENPRSGRLREGNKTTDFQCEDKVRIEGKKRRNHHEVFPHPFDVKSYYGILHHG